MKTKLFFTVVAFSAMTVFAAGQTAQTAPQVQPGQGQASVNAWVDANNNGVCDNFEDGSRPGRRAYSTGENQAAANRGPGKGQGLAQGPGKGHPRGDGMMAGRGAGRGHAMMAGRGAGRGHAKMAGRGAGRGHAMMAGRGAGRGQGVAPGRGLHNGQGPAFIDANKDGVCDNLATAPEKK